MRSAAPDRPARPLKVTRGAWESSIRTVASSLKSSRGMETLKCRNWRVGDDFADIAAQDGSIVKYLGQMLVFTFLSPKLVRAILEGRQPRALITNWIRRREPSVFSAERDRISEHSRYTFGYLQNAVCDCWPSGPSLGPLSPSADVTTPANSLKDRTNSAPVKINC